MLSSPCTFKIETVDSSETSVNMYWTTVSYPKVSILHSHRRECPVFVKDEIWTYSLRVWRRYISLYQLCRFFNNNVAYSPACLCFSNTLVVWRWSFSGMWCQRVRRTPYLHVYSSETLVSFHQNARHHISEGNNLHSHRCGNIDIFR